MAASVSNYAGVSDFFTPDPTKTTTGHSWSAGDVIVVIGIAENGFGTSYDPLVNVPTNANLTFSVLIDRAGTGVGSGDPALKVWTATAGSAQTSQTISLTKNTETLDWGFTTYVVTGTSGVGDYDSRLSTTTTPTLSLTAVEDSVVLFGVCDWSAAIDSATVDPSTNDSGATGYEDITPDGNGSTYGGWFGHFTGTTAGTHTYGFSPITGLAVTTAGVVMHPAEKVIAFDDFNRSNQTLDTSSNWTNDWGGDTASIVSNHVESSTGGDQGNAWSVGTFDDDQWVDFDYSLSGSTGFSGVVAWLRHTAWNSAYAAEVSQNGGTGVYVRLYEVTSGGWNQIGATASLTGYQTGRLRFEAIGTQLIVYLDGLPVISQTHTTYTSGVAAFHLFTAGGTAVQIDNFRAGDWTPKRVVATDDFNRANNSSLGIYWSELGGGTLQVASNAVTGSTANTGSTAIWDAGTFGDDQWSEVDVTLGSTVATEGGPIVRGNLSNSAGYVFLWYPDSGGTYGIYEISSVGSMTLVGSEVTGVGQTGTRRLRLEVIGNVLTGYVDDEAVLSVTDTSITSGYAGIEMWFGTSGATSTLDNFAAGDWKVENVLATDDFNRANGGLGSNWTTLTAADAGPVISSNKAVGPTTGTSWGDAAIWTADTFADDQWVESDITFDANGDGELLIRANTAGTQGYLAVWEGAQITIYELPSLSVLAVDNSGGPTSGTHKFRFEAIGDLLTLYIDGVSALTVTDPTWTSGSPGISFYRTGAGTGYQTDNFRAGDWDASGGPTTVTINAVGSTSGSYSDTGQLTVSGSTIIDYLIEYRTTTGPGVWTPFSDGVNATTGATVTGLIPGVSYDFRVSAVNVSGAGPWSNIATVVASGAGTVNLKLGDNSISALKLGDLSVSAAYLGDIQIL